jgi:deoxyribodipyrimidine photo-lyase
MATSVMWFRRDLRLSDNPALAAAAHHAAATAGRGDHVGDGEVLALFCLDDRLRRPAGAARLAFLSGCLTALDASIDGRLVVRPGPPDEVVPALAREFGASAVFVAEDVGPYGRRRDEAVEAALAGAGIAFERVGSPYAVAPGDVLNQQGEPYKVFTPFSRAWKDHGWPAPIAAPASVAWAKVPARRGDGIPPAPEVGAALPEPGEDAAKRTARRFWDSRLAAYADARDRPGVDATSRLSPYLKWGCLHPRQLLSKLGRQRSHEAFRTELCWREFYADVLWHRPETAREAFQPRMAAMDVDSGPRTHALFEAWSQGRTGYPIVDAAMRQLLAEGWMHNRARMIVAGFLVKDLHLDWTRGARWFMDHLVDGDLASNQHGWQWVAGTGTDAAPYVRVFNPTSQGERFDPTGEYVRRYVRELRSVRGKAVHRPWALAGGPPAGYPEPIVDHAEERAEALRRYDALG